MTAPLVVVNLIFDLIALNSVSVRVAPFAVISLLIAWVATCGVYLVACVNTLKTTRVGLDGVLVGLFNTLPEASVATT